MLIEDNDLHWNLEFHLKMQIVEDVMGTISNPKITYCETFSLRMSRGPYSSSIFNQQQLWHTNIISQNIQRMSSSNALNSSLDEWSNNNNICSLASDCLLQAIHNFVSPSGLPVPLWCSYIYIIWTWASKDSWFEVLQCRWYLCTVICHFEGFSWAACWYYVIR